MNKTKKAKVIVEGWAIVPLIFFSTLGIIDFIFFVGLGSYLLIHGKF